MNENTPVTLSNHRSFPFEYTLSSCLVPVPPQPRLCVMLLGKGSALQLFAVSPSDDLPGGSQDDVPDFPSLFHYVIVDRTPGLVFHPHTGILPLLMM